MEGKYEYLATLGIGFPTAYKQTKFTVKQMGYDPESWDSLTQEEREEELNTFVESWASNYIDMNWS